MIMQQVLPDERLPVDRVWTIILARVEDDISLTKPCSQPRGGSELSDRRSEKKCDPVALPPGDGTLKVLREDVIERYGNVPINLFVLNGRMNMECLPVMANDPHAIYAICVA